LLNWLTSSPPSWILLSFAGTSLLRSFDTWAVALLVNATPHDFVLPCDGKPPADVVRAALAPRFTVTPDGRPRTLRLAWLDTFDWRLYHAGLTLAHTTGSRTSDYTLTSEDGEQIAAKASGLRWPALAGTLPPGPLRARLLPITSVRALLPVARAAAAVRPLRVLNDDEKTIAWLTINEPSAAGPGGAALPPRVSVTAVRGYQAQTDRVISCLTTAADVTPALLSPLDSVLAAAGRRPGDYSGKIDVELTPDMPARTAMQTILLELLDTLEANVPGAIRDTDTEFLHDLRVAVRRTRSAIKLCGDVLAAGVAEEFRGEFKWLGDVTTPIRDLDVYLLGYGGMAASLLAATPAELAPFHDHLTVARAAAQRDLARALRSRRFVDLTRAWRAALTAPAPRRGLTAARLAADRIGRANRKVLAQGSAITAHSPPESLHDLRKRCKELRYLLEFFGSLHDPAIHRQAVQDLKGLQDCLGEYQDCQVQQHEIRMFADQMMSERDVPATALLAMGELAGRIARLERRARREFAGRFADFASAANQQRFRALTSDTSR
jgi:CHAD domain-containing protein